MSNFVNKKITVVSIDDHALVRQGIYHILSQSTDIELAKLRLKPTSQVGRCG